MRRTHKVQRERGVVRRRVLDADVGQQARELRVRDCRRPSAPAYAYGAARTVAPVEEGEQVQRRQARQDMQVDYPHPRVSTDARAADADDHALLRTSRRSSSGVYSACFSSLIAGEEAMRVAYRRARHMYGRDVARGGADGAMRAPDGPSAPGPGLARARVIAQCADACVRLR
jgi:hypothetical protein